MSKGCLNYSVKETYKQSMYDDVMLEWCGDFNVPNTLIFDIISFKMIVPRHNDVYKSSDDQYPWEYIQVSRSLQERHNVVVIMAL